MADNTPNLPVDESNAHERRNSLERHLQTRPATRDLRDRNILMNTRAAPSLHLVALELERQRLADNLKKGLEKRPEREELIERNILPDSNAAPALLGQQRELQKHMRADSLEKQLQARPKPEELVKEGILQADEDPTVG